MVEKLPTRLTNGASKKGLESRLGQRMPSTGEHVVQRQVSEAFKVTQPSRAEYAMPPEGPSNIIVVTPNFLPAPKNVRSQ